MSCLVQFYVLWFFLQMHYRWEQQYEDQIWKIFNHRGSERLKNIFNDICTIDKQPAWISDAVWAGLKAYWNGVGTTPSIPEVPNEACFDESDGDDLC